MNEPEKLLRIATKADIAVPKVSTIWDTLASEHAKAWVDALIAEDAKIGFPRRIPTRRTQIYAGGAWRHSKIHCP